MTQMNLDDIDRKFWQNVANENDYRKIYSKTKRESAMSFFNWSLVFSYFVRIGDAISQLINVTLFFGDNPNESISGRAHRQKNKNKMWWIFRCLINLVFFFQDDHCALAFSADLDRARKMLL